MIVAPGTDTSVLWRLGQDYREPVAIDIETDAGPLGAGGVVRGFGIAVGDDSWYFPLTHPESTNLQVSEARDYVAAAAMHKTVCMHNGPFDRFGLWLVFGIEFGDAQVYDTQTGDWMMNESGDHRLKYIGQRLFGSEARAEQEALKELNRGRRVADVYRELRDPINMLARADREPAALTHERARQIAQASKKSWAKYTAEDIAAYCEQDCLLTLGVHDHQQDFFDRNPEYREGLEREQRVDGLAYRMRKVGVAVDLGLARASLEVAEAEASRLAEPWAHVNLKSAPQVQQMLYGAEPEGWGLPVQYHPKSGAVTTRKAALEALAYDPRVVSLMAYRTVTKQIDAFFVPLINRGGRVHPSWAAHRPVTGRWACSDPNLMQIPREGDVRDCIVPDPGFVFVHADLPSAELRVAAIISGEESWLEVLRAGGDMHQMMADRGGFTRQAGKTMNYANLYGQGPKALAQKMGELTGRFWSVKEAKVIWLAYWKAVPRIKRLMDGLGEMWVRRGRLPIKPWPGRFRHRINGKTGFPEPSYVALNSIIQGSIAELVKDWMLDIEAHVIAMGGYIAAQIHDALVLAVPIGREAEAAALMQESFDRINVGKFDTLAWPLDTEYRF